MAAGAPGALDRLALSLTRAMPNNWLGLRLAILFRRIVTSRLGRGALDTELWGLRLRLYALGNGCEKNALFTPQMFDVMERGMFWRTRSDARREGFTFVDIGANVGLYSLFVASRAANARILAIEPQPGILDRLRFNLAANPGVKVDVLPIALADRDGTVELVLDTSDSGGTHIENRDAPRSRRERVGAVQAVDLGLARGRHLIHRRAQDRRGGRRGRRAGAVFP